jgi:NAD(P)-dependent dehydrogenase (short-subunit alcohol dehydrogenase family)
MEGHTAFNPSSDIPSLEERVVVITGGTGGLGRMTVCALAAHNPAHIFFTGRSEARAKEVIEEANGLAPNTPVSFVPMDLASLTSINQATKELQAKTKRIDLLFCNAGIMAVPASTTKDGYEIQFGTNHLGHAMLVHQILPILLETAKKPGSDVRIISNTSTGFKNPPSGGIEFDRLHSEQDLGIGGRWIRYGQSKLANILFMSEMARRYPEIKSVTIHPGVIKTDLVTSLSTADQALIYASNVGKMLSSEDGVKNQLFAATRARTDLVNGEFYEPVGVVGRHTNLSRDKALAAKLWNWTNMEIEKFFER